MTAPHEPKMFKGILFICLAVLCLKSMDVFAKYLRVDHTTQEILLYRAAVGLPILLIIAIGSGNLKDSISPRFLHLHAARSCCLFFGHFSFIYGLATIPLGTLTAIAFVTPSVIAIMAILFLGEKVRAHRWAAIILGFIGVLIIIQPSADVSWPMILVLMSTAAWGGAAVINKKFPSDVSSLGIAFWFLVLLLLISGAMVLPDWRNALTFDWPMVVGLGVCGALGQLCVTYGYRLAEVSAVAPFEYTAMIWAVLADMVLFATLPEMHVWAGSCLVIISGLYIAHRERVRRHQKALDG